jgi:hypothetical protein
MAWNPVVGKQIIAKTERVRSASRKRRNFNAIINRVKEISVRWGSANCAAATIRTTADFATARFRHCPISPLPDPLPIPDPLLDSPLVPEPLAEPSTDPTPELLLLETELPLPIVVDVDVEPWGGVV